MHFIVVVVVVVFDVVVVVVVVVKVRFLPNDPKSPGHSDFVKKKL